MGERSEPKVVPAPWLKDRDRIRKLLARFLIGAGLVLLLYVSSQYWQTYAGQRKLALEWQQQNARSDNIVADDGDALVRLTIAKINLDAVVVEGTSYRSLKLVPGHMQNSAVLGSSRNAVIVAHFFSPSRRLERGMRSISATGEVI